MDLIDELRADYARFPQEQSYHLYAKDVYFRDPMTTFRGVDRYQEMIGFMTRWFRDPKLELHSISQNGQSIRTDWTLSWVTPLPWKPRVYICGWSDLTVNRAGLIDSHIDSWHCSKWSVLTQHFPYFRPSNQ
jgi:Uncharacterized conserved protein (DUF2358)